MSNPPRIQSIERHPRAIELAWDDGQSGSFHHIWLRDNCACDRCGDRSGGHRYLELIDIDPDTAPARVRIGDDGDLEIEWDGDAHLTRYTAAWLHAHSYSRPGSTTKRIGPVLWNNELNRDYPIWEYARSIDDEAYRFDMFCQIESHGFAVLEGVPVASDQIEKLAALFGFIRETHYGRVFELISTPRQRILAQTAHAIRPHNDELFRAPIPGLFMMHCLRASECGGGASILVDGFAVAEQLRADDPDAFALLCNVPIPHRRFLVDEVDDVALAAKWPVIELDSHGDITAVHINERTMAPLDAPPELTEPVYRALRVMLQRLYAENARIEHRLEPGQAVVMDNHRVLHARTAFNGNRHIRQCHVDRDEFLSRSRALQRRLDPAAWREQHGT